MEKLQLKGSIHAIGQTEIKSEKFSKRDLVLSVPDGNYTQYLNIQFNNANCDKLDAFSIGQQVMIAINLRGRLWTGADGIEKCFNSIEGWAIVDENDYANHKANQSAAPKNAVHGSGNIENNFVEDSIRNMAEDDDDLPF